MTETNRRMGTPSPRGRLSDSRQEQDDRSGLGSVVLRNGRLIQLRDTNDIARQRASVSLRHGRLVSSHSSSVAAAEEEGTTSRPPEIYEVTSSQERILAGMLVVSLMLPFSYNLGGLRLPPYLIMLLLLLFPSVGALLSGRKIRIIIPDALMLLFCLWATTALAISVGFNESIQSAGVHFLTTFGAYIAGRLLIRDQCSMRSMVRVGVICIAVILPFIAIEALTGKKLILQAASLLGSATPTVDIGARLGLTRAQGPFEHPILMGVFCASMLSLGFYAFRSSPYLVLRWIAAPVSVIAGVLSLSTGALLSLNIQFGLMLWARIFRTMSSRWLLLSALLVAAYIGIDILSNRTPFHVFVSYATFSSGSSYNRILIWQFGSAEALRHPFFGIGMGDWERPKYMSNSMDNFWLVQAVKFGIPAFVMLTSAIVIILRRAGKAAFVSPDLILLRRGAIFSIVATMTAIVSVHLWNASYVWFMFLIGATAWMGIEPASNKVSVMRRPA